MAIAPVDPAEVATIEHDVNVLWELVEKAADAYYSRDDSVGGNALMAEAQSHSLNVNNEMEGIVIELSDRHFATRCFNAQCPTGSRPVDSQRHHRSRCCVECHCAHRALHQRSAA